MNKIIDGYFDEVGTEITVEIDGVRYTRIVQESPYDYNFIMLDDNNIYTKLYESDFTRI